MASRACRGFSFWFLTSRVGDENTLRVPTARDWRSQSRFQVFPSETSRVSKTPLFELLNEEDPGLLQNHYGESSVVGSLYVSAGATLAGLSWTLPVPSTLSLRLTESLPACPMAPSYRCFISWSSSRCAHLSRASRPLSPQTPPKRAIAQLSILVTEM